MREPIIRPFEPNEWLLYRDARLAALMDSPDAFGSTYERSKTFSDSEWQARLTDARPDSDLALGVFVAAKVVGMSWTKVDSDDEKIAHLFGMWVDPRFRGRGIARRLLDASAKWARGLGLDELGLDVTLGNTPAQKLYEAAGFSRVGVTEPLREGSELRVQSMILKLSGGS